MKKLVLPLLLLFLGGFVLISSKSSQVDKELEKKIDEVFKTWDSTESPGGVIGIFDKGELVFSKAYGMASLEYDVVNTTETVFNIASVTKQITAFTMVLLEQQGKLSIDDDVRKYLPEVPDFGTTITIRHLLTHTSGLRNFQNILAMAGWRSGESMTNEDLLRFISMQKELNFPVGEEYLYCNTGFNLITAIVERITGQTFQDWTKENIFDPLDMDHTSYREDMEVVHKNTATSYDGSLEEGFRQPLKYWTYMGNGNVYTTVRDLARWLDNFRQPKLGGEAGIKRLLEEGILNNGEGTGYALGIGVGEYRGLDRISHGGSVGGYRSSLMYFPEKEVGVILIANFSSAGAGGKATAVADLYLDKDFPKPKPAPRNRLEHLSKAVSISNQAFDACAGEYLVEGIRVKLYREGGQFLVHAVDYAPVMPLKAASEKSFFVEEAPISIFASLGDDGKAGSITVLEGEDRMRGPRIDPSASNSDLLKKYAGTYYSEELDTRYHFVVEEGKLMARHQRHNDFQILPLTKSSMMADAYFLRNIDVQWEGNEVKGIRVTNGRVRNLWFEKLD
jgi:CubicO group peptidase (beta-lactamase class C family)